MYIYIYIHTYLYVHAYIHIEQPFMTLYFRTLKFFQRLNGTVKYRVVMLTSSLTPWPTKKP